MGRNGVFCVDNLLIVREVLGCSPRRAVDLCGVPKGRVR